MLYRVVGSYPIGYDPTVPNRKGKDRGCKIQGRIPAYELWVIHQLIQRGMVGYNESNAVSSMVREWIADRRPLVRKLKLSETDYERARAATDGPVVPFPRRPRGLSGHQGHWPQKRSGGAVVVTNRSGSGI